MKQKWILLAIYIVEFLTAMYFLYLFGLLDTTKVVNEVVIGLIVGIVVAIVTVYLTLMHTREDKKAEKKEQERKKRCEELKSQIYNHIKLLILPVLKDRYAKQKPISLVDHQKAIEHLQGYPNLWALFEEVNVLKNQISEDEKTIKEYVKGKSYLELIDALDGDYLFQEEMNDWGKVSLKKGIDLIDELLDNANIGKLKDNYIVENSKKIIETFENDDNLSKMFKKRKEDKVYMDEKINEFDKSLHKIVYDFEKRDILLEGKCEDCKDWHDELESLK